MNQVQPMVLLPASLASDSCCKGASFLPSPVLDIEERIQHLQGLIINHSSCEKGCETYARLKSALREARSLKREVDARLAFQKDYFLSGLTGLLPLCVEHAVLDSRTEVPGSTAGLMEGTAIQFFLTMLHFFDPENASGEVEHLKRVLDDLFELWVYQEDFRYPRPESLDDAAQLFHDKVARLLRDLQQEKPYFFFPLASWGHAMLGKVEWIQQEGFRLTIINKGECAQFRHGESAADLIYLGLTQEEVLRAIMANFNLSPATSRIYENIKSALPVEKQERFMGRSHGLHKRESCSLKSLAGAIHGVLPAGMYRYFKVFYTSRLIDGMGPGQQFNAACEVLLKRKTKCYFSDIDN